MFHRNVVIAEVHVWIHAELITPLGVELHVIDLDAEEDVQTDGVEAEGVDQEAESLDQGAESAEETHVEDDENAMQDECDSARGAGQTNEDEDDGLMSGYSSDDAPLDAVSENEGDEDEDEGEDVDEDEPEDPMKNYLYRNIYEGAEGEDQKIHLQQGMIFENVDKFREVLRDYVVQEGFVIVRLKNERTRVTCLDEMLGGFDVDRPWTFMSDRQKGLLECINDMVPYAINRRCAKHLFANFKQHFSGMPLKKYFWQACRSYNEQGFNSAMKKIQEFKPAAAEWLMKIDVSMWARYAFPVD
ncbi:UNVERIFIED_CONTAM: hypothetical protein Sradi_2518100 [Sesamum radiatum]|uniref:Transposase MuDR plant domain-containing protein n=1 Tax=Sesamum radiatum TaxID=300843 RepID=A0AAW2SKG2_SESRA